MNPEGQAGLLPAEIWLYIHRLATSDTSPLALCHAGQFQYVPITDPLKDVEHFWRDTYSFVLVCRLWNSLATELLYENIRVDEKCDILCTSLRRPGHGDLVRSVRLSPTRLDRNCAILALCPRVQVIVKPDATREDVTRFCNLNWDIDTALWLPFHSWKMPFQFLKQIYWAETALDSTLLRSLIRVAPHLQYLFMSSSTVLATDSETRAFPPIAHLRRLTLVSASEILAASILKADLHNLTRLNCSPSLFAIADVPVFASLRMLELFGSRSIIPFKVIFLRCPRLWELCYDVWNSLSSPEPEHSFPPLSCIRLHSAVTVVRDWSSIQSHFGLFVSADFPKIQRLVLHGSWYRVVDNTLFTPFLNDLRAQGCQVEFPEGQVL
ncbi:hypothetical protein MVEN_02356400 [Mycena venus]|uniref:Uncharacterized protein n=1 Tax=Mycena venus TaxID=2733690 RepID=A0A8H6X3L4_9AGAR|nr:hypothetical protein MVEN_02356400 [Mycena venus]